MRLTESDYSALERCFIPRALADGAGLYRVDSLEGRELVGRRTSPGDYSGIIFPYRWPGTSHAVIVRLRLDHPPIDSSGKTSYKYLVAPGARNHLYCPLADPAHLNDTTIDAVISEGEKKGLSLVHTSTWGQGQGRPPLLALTIPGVWAWRGQIGITTDATGQRVREMGVIPDFDRIEWPGRRVFLVFDVNCATNSSVHAARQGLARELRNRGATVHLVDLPADGGINGVDDFLAAAGPEAFFDLLDHAARYDWHDELAISDKGKILPTFSNALIALRLAPEWQGVLVYNEFALRHEMRGTPPWGGEPGPWTDYLDSRLIEWMEQQGIRITDAHATRAAIAAAQEHPVHPVREYLAGLHWDGIPRINDWLTLYMGVEPSEYVRAVGARWLISAVARAREFGSKTDHVLIFEGPQGRGKSSSFEILGGEFYSDDIAELGTKDAALGAAGVWIVELAELDSMRRAEVSKINSFLSRRVDRFRPPYGRHLITVPRQCVFGGSVNQARYLKDDTGARRFWPVKCGEYLGLDSLRRDRDQLWAEAVLRYEKGEPWWLDTTDLIAAATVEQEERHDPHPWEEKVAKWLLNQVECTTADVLTQAIGKDVAYWTRTDEIEIGKILRRLGWEVSGRATNGTRRRLYRETGGIGLGTTP